MPAAESSSTSSSPNPSNGGTAAAASASAHPYLAATNFRGERQAPPIRRSAKACVACRKAKARCDGPELWPCRRCREACHECVFEGVPQDELGTKLAQAVASAEPVAIGSSTPWSTERRLLQLEQELALLRRLTQDHTAKFVQLEASLKSSASAKAKGKEKEVITPTTDSNATASFEHILASIPHSQSNGNGHGDSAMSFSTPNRIRTHTMEFSNVEMSIDDPALNALSRAAFDTFWTSMAPWAPYVDPSYDSFDNVIRRSPLLFYCMLAVATRFHGNLQWAHYCEQQALKFMRATLYSEEPPTLDDLKGSLLYNAWLSRGAPPGHSCTLAAQLGLPRVLERLLSSMDKPDAGTSFELLMPAIRTWLCLYAQDLWLSIGTGRRSMVTIDFSITSARSLLKFEALRAVDARAIALCELVTILGGVQENFVKTQQISIDKTIDIVQRADEHVDNWVHTWTEWAHLQEEKTGLYMTSSFAMQNHIGRFYINTLGLRDISSPEEVRSVQMPVIKSAIKHAYEVQIAAQTYGTKRMGFATEFILISCSSAALFLLKMIKLMPELFESGKAERDVSSTLQAVRTTSKLLAGAPRQNYHLAVAGALSHLESQFLAPSASLTTLTEPIPVNTSLPMDSSNGSTPTGPQHDVLFDPELELAIASVIEESDFWSWSQAQPADSFSGLMS